MKQALCIEFLVLPSDFRIHHSGFLGWLTFWRVPRWATFGQRLWDFNPEENYVVIMQDYYNPLIHYITHRIHVWYIC